MKRIVTAFLVFSITACTKNEPSVLGTWTVNSKFYRATCKIIEDGDFVKGVVLYYNDDTTIYRYERGKQVRYFFTNLKKNDGVYIDAISGATKTNAKAETVTLKLRHQDTLEVTSYIMHKPLKETWIRTQI